MKSHAEPVSLKSAQYLSFVSVIFTLTLCIAIAQLAYAATFTVMNTNDSGAGSLRQAIADASAGDTIDFDSAVTGTITLTSGQLTIDKNLTILGPGADRLTISGGGTVRIFTVNDGMRLDLQGLTVANGSAAGANGGGVMNSGTSIITACAFSSSTASIALAAVCLPFQTALSPAIMPPTAGAFTTAVRPPPPSPTARFLPIQLQPRVAPSARIAQVPLQSPTAPFRETALGQGTEVRYTKQPLPRR
jgi:hypothetical protein